MKDLNIISETIKLPEENVGSLLFEICFSNMFLDLSLQTRTTNAKINARSHQTKKLLHSVGNHQQHERQPTEQGKVFANGTSNKELIGKIYKELIKLNSQVI